MSVESCPCLHQGDGEDTDHLAEITQLKEKIAMLQKTIGAKNNELVAKQAEMNQVRILRRRVFQSLHAVWFNGDKLSGTI